MNSSYKLHKGQLNLISKIKLNYDHTYRSCDLLHLDT